MGELSYLINLKNISLIRLKDLVTINNIEELRKEKETYDFINYKIRKLVGPNTNIQSNINLVTRPSNNFSNYAEYKSTQSTLQQSTQQNPKSTNLLLFEEQSRNLFPQFKEIDQVNKQEPVTQSTNTFSYIDKNIDTKNLFPISNGNNIENYSSNYSEYSDY